MQHCSKESALFYLMHNDINHFKQIIKGKGFKIDSMFERGRTLLHIACFYKKADFIEVLIENNANINATNINGTTPLMYAKSNIVPSEYLILDFLIEKGANLYQKDNFGLTVLDYIDNLDVKKYLLKISKKK